MYSGGHEHEKQREIGYEVGIGTAFPKRLFSAFACGISNDIQHKD